MEDLGVIQGNLKGIMQHNLLLMNELSQPLGLIDQQYWTRKGDKDFEGKESLKWTNGLEAINTHLRESRQKVVLVQDCEADIFNFFKAKRASLVELLVRVHQPRMLANQCVAKLEVVGKRLSDVGRKEVIIHRNNVNVPPDKDLNTTKHQIQGLSLVIAEEIACVDSTTGEDVFKETDKASGYLLTSVPIDNQADAQRIVHFYALRWRIERFHYTLKSGALNVEKLQFDDIHSMLNALSFYSIVAWQHGFDILY
jgi:hypothetical protein